MSIDHKHLALDGPLNGQYISSGEAFVNYYYEDKWFPGEPEEEVVFVHSSSFDYDYALIHVEDEDFVLEYLGIAE